MTARPNLLQIMNPRIRCVQEAQAIVCISSAYDAHRSGELREQFAWRRVNLALIRSGCVADENVGTRS